MESQNLGYTDDGGASANDYDQSQYQMDDQGQGYVPPVAPAQPGGMVAAFNSMVSGSLFRSEEMALCQLFLQVRFLLKCSGSILDVYSTPSFAV